MFTGIIEGLGSISGISSSGTGRRLAVESDYDLENSRVGDSISVSGACLTVVKLDQKRFEADVSQETIEKTTFASARIGDRVNLERAMRLSDRIDGHLVSGHIDGMGIIQHRENVANAIMVTIAVPAAQTRYMIPKGSVAVDGISLTINSVDKEAFSASIIPHTAKITTLGIKRIGDAVNIETDMIGKYVERFLRGGALPRNENAPETSGIDMEFLAKTGFI